MGLFDSLAGEFKGGLGQFAEAEIVNLLPTALAATNLGSLQGIVNQLQQADWATGTGVDQRRGASR